MSRIAEVKQQVDRIWVASFHTDLADTLTQQLRQQARLSVQATLEAALREEVASYRDHLRTTARASGRTPSTFRCAGSYRCIVLTAYGLIPDLCVPKLRSGNAERPWQILTRYQLAMQVGLDQAVYLYTLAAQSPMQRWRTRPITDTPPILIVDGVWVQILAPTSQTWRDRSGHERQEMRGQERVVLAVLGVWEDGHYELLH